jgi:hypothetical protein
MDFPASVLNPNSGEVALNMKVLADDNMEHSRRRASNDADYDKALNQIHLTERTDAQTLKHLAAINLLTSSQTGQTENQQTVSPVRTATGDAIVGGVGVSAEQVAANIANLATALIPVIATAVAQSTATAVTSILPALVTAVGGSSTPSQTEPKPVTAPAPSPAAL